MTATPTRYHVVCCETGALDSTHDTHRYAVRRVENLYRLFAGAAGTYCIMPDTWDTP